jgi:hypothetical protein
MGWYHCFYLGRIVNLILLKDRPKKRQSKESEIDHKSLVFPYDFINKNN